MHTVLSILLAAIVALSAVSLSASQTTSAQTETSTSISGGFANVQTVQNDNHIIVTITKAGAEAPTGPIVIPDVDAGDNGTIIVPDENVPAGENATDVIVIEPDGNVTTVPDGNVTNIDNSTVVVAPDNQTVSVTPGGVVVVDTPVCGCPAEPVAPEDATTTPAEEPAVNDTEDLTIEPLPADNENDTGSEDNNGTNPFLDTLGLQS
jgi:hypothetical protein